VRAGWTPVLGAGLAIAVAGVVVLARSPAETRRPLSSRRGPFRPRRTGDDGRKPSWDDVVAIGRGLPEVEESTWYRTPSLEVRGKGFARLRTEAEGVAGADVQPGGEGGAAGLGRPGLHDHAALRRLRRRLVDLERVDPAQLPELVEEAWRLKAPARLRRDR
jgi:hypothetical protein